MIDVLALIIVIQIIVFLAYNKIGIVKFYTIGIGSEIFLYSPHIELRLYINASLDSLTEKCLS